MERVAALLGMESRKGLRPLELASQETLSLMNAMFDTPDMYVASNEIVGVSVYQWYDITEYVISDV